MVTTATPGVVEVVLVDLLVLGRPLPWAFAAVGVPRAMVIRKTAARGSVRTAVTAYDALVVGVAGVVVVLPGVVAAGAFFNCRTA